MPVDETIRSALALQRHYSPVNTPFMKERGLLIRDSIPASIRVIRTSLAAAAGIEQSDFFIEGRDGTGRKSEVPWIRFASKLKSPSATVGWYVVWLLRRDGEGAYLALAHGSAEMKSGSMVIRSDHELASLMTWSRSALAPELSRFPALETKIRLASRTSLAIGYEKSCVTAFYYPAGALPENAQLEHDMLAMAGLLGKIYEAERLGQMPLTTSPEVRDALASSTEIARPGATSNRQGFSLTAAERIAVELHAMQAATQHLEARGFVVKDVSRTESFDLLAERDTELLKVEVKGTTGTLGSVLLTANEVELHKHEFPSNALLVIHSIALSRGGNHPLASGGQLRAWIPWQLDEDRLKGITYSYALEGL